MKVGRLQADFVEGMMCEGGCVGGPSQHRSEMQFKKDRDTLIAEADDRGVHENLESVDMEAFAMHRLNMAFCKKRIGFMRFDKIVKVHEGAFIDQV